MSENTIKNLFTIEDLTKPLKAQLDVTQQQLEVLQASVALFIGQVAKPSVNFGDEKLDIQTYSKDLLREGLALLDVIDIKLKNISAITSALERHKNNIAISTLLTTDSHKEEIAELNKKINLLNSTNSALQTLIDELKSKNSEKLC